MVTKYDTQKSDEVEVYDETMDDFIHQRSKILKTILGVLLLEVKSRLGLRKNNIRRIDEDQSRIEDLVGSMRTFWNCNGLKYDDRDVFLKLQGMTDTLRKERREQDVTCWNDVVGVMNNQLLNRWEAHQQTTARARLMQGGGLEKIIEGEFQKKREEFTNDRLKTEGNLH